MSDVDPIEALFHESCLWNEGHEPDACDVLLPDGREEWCLACRARAALPALRAMREERDEALAAMSSDGADAVRDNAALRARVRELERCADILRRSFDHKLNQEEVRTLGEEAYAVLTVLDPTWLARAASRGAQP